MDQPAQTLHEFVVNLLTDPQSLSAFQADPQSALAGAGLGDVNASEVHEIVPLVMDYLPMHGAGAGAMSGALPAGAAGGQQAAIDQLQRLTHAFSVAPHGDGLQGTFDYADPQSGAHGASSLVASLSDGLAGNEAAVSPLGAALFSGSATPGGEFVGNTHVASDGAGTASSTGFTGSLADGFAGSGDVASPLGGGKADGVVTPDGDFYDSATVAGDGSGGSAHGVLSGNLADGFSGAGNVQSPFGGGHATAAGDAGGNLAGSAHLGGEALGSFLTGATGGGLADGVNVYGQFAAPAGDGDYSLALPGVDDLGDPHVGATALDHSFTDGSNTVASALAAPMAGGDPADAIDALFGSVPTFGDAAAPSLDFTPANPLGSVPPVADAVPQVPLGAQHPAGPVTDTVRHAADQLAQHAQLPGSAGAAQHVAPQHQAAEVAGQLDSTVHHTLDTVTDHLHSATSGLASHVPASDPSQAVQSVTSQVSDHVTQGVTQSPVGGDGGGVSSDTHLVTDALEHNHLTDALHDLGHGLDLHL